MLVIMLNCVTLGMFRPCEDVECRSERCGILEVGGVGVGAWRWAGPGGRSWVRAEPRGRAGAGPVTGGPGRVRGAGPALRPPSCRPLTTSSSPSSRWRWSSRWSPWGCLGRSATWATRGTGWTSSSSWRGTAPPPRASLERPRCLVRPAWERPRGAPGGEMGRCTQAGRGPGSAWGGVPGAGPIPDPCVSTRDGGADTRCPGRLVSGEDPPVLSRGCAFPTSGQPGWVHGMGIMSPASAHLLASAARVPWREPGARWPSSDPLSQHVPSLSMPLLCPQYDGVLLGWTQREPLGHPNRARTAAPSCHQPCAQ